MKFVFSLILLLSASTSFASDFFRFQDSLFRNNEVCDSSMTQDSKAYLAMYNTLKHDDDMGHGSKIEVLDDSVFSSELKDKTTGEACALILHDGCYSVMCN